MKIIRVLAGTVVGAAIALLLLLGPLNNVIPIVDLEIDGAPVTLFGKQPDFISGMSGFWSLHALSGVCSEWGSKCDGAKVMKLYDQTRNGMDMTPGSSAPKLATDCGGFSPCIRFDGQFDELAIRN